MSNIDHNLPDFKDDPKLWFYIWRTINFQWEKAWQERTDQTEAWWLGHMAGKLFRFREISGFADAYWHGSLTCGSTTLVPQGRKFSETEMKMREKIHARRRETEFVDLSCKTCQKRALEDAKAAKEKK